MKMLAKLFKFLLSESYEIDWDHMHEIWKTFIFSEDYVYTRYSLCIIALHGYVM